MRPRFSSPILGGNIRRTPCLRGFDTHRFAGSAMFPPRLRFPAPFSGDRLGDLTSQRFVYMSLFLIHSASSN